MTLKDYTRGTLGHAPVNGRYFFVHRATRLVRATDMKTLPPAEGWEQVSLPQWEAFRAETKKMNPKKVLEFHRSYACSSTTKSELPKSSSSKEISPKPSGKPSSPKRGQSSASSSPKSKSASSKPSTKKVAKARAKSEPSSNYVPTKRQSTPSGKQ